LSTSQREHPTSGINRSHTKEESMRLSKLSGIGRTKQLSIHLALIAIIATISAVSASDDPANLTPRERGTLARAYVLKWGHHVERTYGIPVGVWANRMVPTFAYARSENFRDAMRRTTFESASAALSGRGHRLSDRQVDAALSRLSTSSAASNSELVAKALGSYTSDLTYTPLQPCRILDTRVVGGPIAAGQMRAFNALTAPGGNFTAQGGAGQDCQALTSSEASAVVLNVTSVGPSIAGYATVFPYGFARPATASVNYTAGGIVNNTVITRIPSPINSKDFTIYSLATSDYVVDIVGYFAPPTLTELVTGVFANEKIIPASSEGYINYPECPPGSGYKRTGGYCAGGLGVPNAFLKASGPFACVYFNGSSQAEAFSAVTQCAKVPGR
jgi:hypothetical protein